MDERRHSFVLRIWEERCDEDGAEPLWRGSLEEVQRGHRVYFSTLLELCDHLQTQTGMTGRRSESRDRR
ncbi:MAG TPA: hypothetical protein VIU62_19150 [Chloroflexota bacterium]